MNLCGVISTSLDGAIFFDNIDVLNLIINLIDNKKIDDSKISKVATMILASISALNPFCKHINEAFPIIFKMLNSNQNSPYPIIFIANMASTTNGAFECAKNISNIIQNAELDLPRTIVAIERIMNDNKAKEIFFSEKNDNINSLISLLLNKWNTEKTFLSIVEELSTCERGRKAILDSKLNEILHKQFNEIDLLNESRPLLLRILSRIRS